MTEIAPNDPIKLTMIQHLRQLEHNRQHPLHRVVILDIGKRLEQGLPGGLMQNEGDEIVGDEELVKADYVRMVALAQDFDFFEGGFLHFVAVVLG